MGTRFGVNSKQAAGTAALALLLAMAAGRAAAQQSGAGNAGTNAPQTPLPPAGTPVVSNAVADQGGAKQEERPEDPLWGRFRPTLLGGVVFSQERGGFSESDLYLRFVGDTCWWGELHSQIDVALTTIPVEGSDPTATDPADREFIESEKAYVGNFSLDYRFDVLNTTGNHVLTLGPVAKVGIQSITDHEQRADNVDRVNYFVGGGLRIADCSWDKGTNRPVNPTMIRYVDLLWSRYESLDEPKLTVDAQLRFPSEEGVAYFIGTRAIVGSGEDDLQVTAGLDIPLESLSEWIGNLVPTFLKPKKGE